MNEIEVDDSMRRRWYALGLRHALLDVPELSPERVTEIIERSMRQFDAQLPDTAPATMEVPS